MKKRLIEIIAIILIIVVIAIFVKNKIDKAQIKYDIANVEVYNYVKYRKNEKFGIMDRNGNIILQAKYSNIEIPNPEKDVFICYDEDESVVLNSKNETLFEQYDKIEPIKLKNIASILCYEKTVLKYEKDGLYGLVGLDGNKITQNIYTSMENLQSTEGKLLVGKNDKYGVININGKALVELKYDGVVTDNYYTDETKYVEAGFIVSNTTNDGYRYGYINYQGKKILDVEYSDIVRVTEQKGIYLISAKNGQYGLYKESKQLIKPEYQSIVCTENGAIIVERNKQYGIANLKGEIKVETKYSEIGENGIYLYARNVRENDVYDVEGNKLDISFNKNVYLTGNENYRITTVLNNDVTYYGIENKEGIELVNTNYRYIEYIFGDYFIAENQNEKYGIINANGKTIVNFDYDLIQKIKNKNIVQASLKNSEEIKIYSSKLELVVTMKLATLKNEKNYIKLFNKKESLFLDKDGNQIEESSDIIQKDLQRELPDKIKDYTKIQYSLDDVYYE